MLFLRYFYLPNNDNNQNSRLLVWFLLNNEPEFHHKTQGVMKNMATSPFDSPNFIYSMSTKAKPTTINLITLHFFLQPLKLVVWIVEFQE